MSSRLPGAGGRGRLPDQAVHSPMARYFVMEGPVRLTRPPVLRPWR